MIKIRSHVNTSCVKYLLPIHYVPPIGPACEKQSLKVDDLLGDLELEELPVGGVRHHLEDGPVALAHHPRQAHIVPPQLQRLVRGIHYSSPTFLSKLENKFKLFNPPHYCFRKFREVD